MAEKLSAGSKGRLAENLELFSKIGPTQVLADHLQFSKFLFHLHQSPVDWCPSLASFVAHLSKTKYLLLVCRYVESFRSYGLLPDDAPR